MRYNYVKRVKRYNALKWAVLSVALGIVIACVVQTIKVNEELRGLGL